METYSLAQKMEESISKACLHGGDDISQSLQILFKPLNNNESSIEGDHQATKAKRKWLRLYAVRIAPNCFVITGGAIKLTQGMEEREHTAKELRKIPMIKGFLENHGLYDPDDFEMLEL
jgi:hypothetical protein